MYSFYHFLFVNHIQINIWLILLAIFSIWTILSKKWKKRVYSICKRRYKENKLRNQVIFLVSVGFINIFTYGNLGDYWLETTILSCIVCIIQIIGLILLFVKSNRKDKHIKRTTILGMMSLLLEFTNIYGYLYLNDRTLGPMQNNTLFTGVDSSSPIMMWWDFLFYSLSLVLPYPLTEIQPKFFLPKIISLFQIGIFYLLVFTKLTDAFNLHNSSSGVERK